jgi:cellulose synthase/poly-beta-1,6-N-acetylglucosamine synthase-like glycosyltransferase
VATHTLWVLVHFLAVVVFVNRYIGGMLLRAIRGSKWDETVDDFEPTITVVIPLFNEGAAIQDTLRSVLASDYAKGKLSVVVVDDCSSDDSYELALAIAREDRRLRVLRNATNVGKRLSINRVVRETTSELIVSVDSDVIIDRDAIRQLTRRFVSPRIAAVGGWVDVRNKHDNWLTRMQTIRYWYAYYVMRNIEWGFRRVMCLSGCLTAYRRSVLVELEPILESRSLLGKPIKYGEDRFLTRQIIKAGHLTTVTLAARCQTFVPTTLLAYLSQQLRWRRSNIMDYSCGVGHVWRLNPLLAIHYFSMATVILVYPIGIYWALLTGKFFAAVVLHLAILSFFGFYYRLRTRKWPRNQRVGGLAYVPQSIVMPITNALMTPLALFTLDSTSWETRGHGEPAQQLGHGEPVDLATRGELDDRSREVARDQRMNL